MYAVRKEVAVDRVESKIDIDAAFAPSRYVLYLTDKCSGTAVFYFIVLYCIKKKKKKHTHTIIYKKERK